MEKGNPVKKTAYMSMLLAISLIFSYVEFLVPISVGVPGIKLGLANLVVLIGLYFLRPMEVLLILLARIFLAAFLFGNMSTLLYSLAGGMFSLIIMVLLKRIGIFSMTGVSIAGAVAHNIAQLVVAALVVENAKMVYYLPVLLMGGAIAGTVVGLVGQKCKIIFRS